MHLGCLDHVLQTGLEFFADGVKSFSSRFFGCRVQRIFQRRRQRLLETEAEIELGAVERTRRLVQADVSR